MNAVKCEKIGEIANLVKDYDVVAIDEGQFFTDVMILLNKLFF